MYLVKSVFRVSSLIFFTAEKHCRTRPTNIEAIQHGAYQKIISCYTHEDRRKGRGMMAELIESLAASKAVRVLLQCLFDRFGSVFPQCGLMVFPGVVIVSR